jgi:Na+/proline symporter
MADTGAPTVTPVVNSAIETIETIVPSVIAAVVDDWAVSNAAAWIVLATVLIFFAILAVGSMDKFGCLPLRIQSLCLLNKHGEETTTQDYFLSARDSAGYLSIALSYFASGMGAWVVYGTTEMGANPQLSWLGVLGYSGASAFPATVICIIGPGIKKRCSENAFSTSDFGRERYGRVMQLSISAISIFYMFIYMVAELTSISSIYSLLTNNTSKTFGIGVTVIIGLVTLGYTGYAGLPASIVTDRFQGIIVAFLVIVLTIATCSFEENKVTREEFKAASSWTLEGFMALVTLVLAIMCAELFNQATWQRVWASESTPALRKGFGLGSFMIFILMMFFGIMGMIAYSKDPVAYDTFEKFSFLAFFDLLLPLGNGWHTLVLILVTALAASSLDSLQNGLNSIFYRDALRLGFNAHVTASVLVVLMNVPAIWIASLKMSVLALFLVADLVCATAVLPVFLGLQETDKLGGLLPAPTELGAFLGIISGIVTVLVNGAINEAGLFQYFWLNNGGICALCGKETMITFIVTPLIAGIMTYVFTHVDLLIRGKEGARRPLIELPFDVDEEPQTPADDGKNNSKDEVVEGNVTPEKALKSNASAEMDA